MYSILTKNVDLQLLLLDHGFSLSQGSVTCDMLCKILCKSHDVPVIVQVLTGCRVEENQGGSSYTRRAERKEEREAQSYKHRT